MDCAESGSFNTCFITHCVSIWTNDKIHICILTTWSNTRIQFECKKISGERKNIHFQNHTELHIIVNLRTIVYIKWWQCRLSVHKDRFGLIWFDLLCFACLFFHVRVCVSSSQSADASREKCSCRLHISNATLKWTMVTWYWSVNFLFFVSW